MGDSDTIPPPFITRVDPKQLRAPHDELEETIAPGNAFAVVRGLRSPPTLRFFARNGTLRFAIAYGRLPTVWGDSPALVLLEYPGFGTVILAGKNLAPLEARLCDYRVAWIRECSEQEAATLPVAVTRIERMLRYPSREPDAARSDK